MTSLNFVPQPPNLPIKISSPAPISGLDEFTLNELKNYVLSPTKEESQEQSSGSENTEYSLEGLDLIKLSPLREESQKQPIEPSEPEDPEFIKFLDSLYYDDLFINYPKDEVDHKVLILTPTQTPRLSDLPDTFSPDGHINRDDDCWKYAVSSVIGNILRNLGKDNVINHHALGQLLKNYHAIHLRNKGIPVTDEADIETITSVLLNTLKMLEGHKFFYIRNTFIRDFSEDNLKKDIQEAIIFLQNDRKKLFLINLWCVDGMLGHQVCGCIINDTTILIKNSWGETNLYKFNTSFFTYIFGESCNLENMQYSFILVNHFDSDDTATDVVAAADAAVVAEIAMDDEFTLDHDEGL